MVPFGSEIYDYDIMVMHVTDFFKSFGYIGIADEKSES